MDLSEATDELIDLAARLHDLVRTTGSNAEALDVATDLCRKCTRVLAALVDLVAGGG